MANDEKVKMSQVSVRLSKIIHDYGEEVMEKATKQLRKDAKALRDEIPQTTAFHNSTGFHKPGYIHLKDAFTVRKTTDEDGNIAYNVHALTKGHKYALVHLIENGHENYWNPARPVPAHHFLAPLAEKYQPIVEEDIKKIIQEAASEASSK